MKLILVLLTFCFVQSYSEENKEKEGRFLEEPIESEISVVHSRKMMDYLLENNDDIARSILSRTPGSTQMLSQVTSSALAYTTQAWYRCSRQFDVPRDLLRRYIPSYRTSTNAKEACAVSCYMEESGMVANGKLNPKMVSILTLMSYGDDHDIYRYTQELVKVCNDLPVAPAQSCKSEAYLSCIVKGFQKGDVYIPDQVLKIFATPWIMELTS